MHLYRQRRWVCRVTGKSGLTYEEALLSERAAAARTQAFPPAFVRPVLAHVHFSEHRRQPRAAAAASAARCAQWRRWRCSGAGQARLDELVMSIHEHFRERFVAGEELLGAPGGGNGEAVRCCRVLRALDEDGGAAVAPAAARYEIAWLPEDGGEDGKEAKVSVETGGRLERSGRHPLVKSLLKSFIRESVETAPARGGPWVVHRSLANRLGLPSEPPRHVLELLAAAHLFGGGAVLPNGQAMARHLRTPGLIWQAGAHLAGAQTRDGEAAVKGAQQNVAAGGAGVRYPVEDDLLQVLPSSEGSPGPTPSVEEGTVWRRMGGPLLAVWDFCCTFSRALGLSPFPLEDLEAALDYRDGPVALLAEAHAALLRAALQGNPDLLDSFQQRGRRGLETWCEDVCDWVCVTQVASLQAHVSPMKRGHYAELDPEAKLHILEVLADQAVQAEVVRMQVDESLEQAQAILAERREVNGEARRQRKLGNNGGEEDGNNEEALKENDAEEEKDDSSSNGGGWEEPEEEAEVVDGERSEDDGNEGEDEQEEACREACGDGSAESRQGADIGESGSDAAGPAVWQSKGKRRRANGQADVVANGGLGSRSRGRQAHLRVQAKHRAAEEAHRSRVREEELRALKSDRGRAVCNAQEKRREAQKVSVGRRQLEQVEVTRQKRLESLDRELERCKIRTEALGWDRSFSRYWFFARDGRLWVERAAVDEWAYFSSSEQVDALLAHLDTRGVRELALHRRLSKHYAPITSALARRAKELAVRLSLDEAAVRRSSRVKSAPRAASFLNYTNKLANSW
eukprot:SM000157S02065  [mRNA]  locus=s157:76582:79639:+ [translate_table: standard]